MGVISFSCGIVLPIVPARLVRVHHMLVSAVKKFLHPPQRVFASFAGTKAVTVRSKVLLEERFQSVAKRALNDAVLHGRYPSAHRASLNEIR
jgi:hypothetical protein